MGFLRTQVGGIVHELQKSYGSERSSQWPAVQKKFIILNSVCALCGSLSSLNVHHIKPFHLHPELELDPANLITLCREHHMLFGHLDNWKSYNDKVVDDCHEWNIKIKTRP
jgi:5-methylcytosine-specific restriction protein A